MPLRNSICLRFFKIDYPKTTRIGKDSLTVQKLDNRLETHFKLSSSDFVNFNSRQSLQSKRERRIKQSLSRPVI